MLYIAFNAISVTLKENLTILKLCNKTQNVCKVDYAFVLAKHCCNS